MSNGTKIMDVTTSNSSALDLQGAAPINPVLALTSFMSFFAVLSQFVIILIARGLEGDFSARTFMWVYALAQICQQLAILYMAASNAFG